MFIIHIYLAISGPLTYRWYVHKLAHFVLKTRISGRSSCGFFLHLIEGVFTQPERHRDFAQLRGQWKIDVNFSLILIFVFVLFLNIQLSPTMAFQTFSKMPESMSALSFLNQPFNIRTALKSADLLPGPGFYHVAIRARCRPCSPEN